MDAVVRKTIAALRHPARRDGCTHKTLQCDFWNWGPDHVRPDCCTEHLREVLCFTEDLLSRHGIQHWLEFGTLLGAVRDETFIPWDDDGDFGMLADDCDRILALKREIKAAGYYLRVDPSRPGEVRINYSRVNSMGVDLWMWARRGDLLVGTFTDGFDWPGANGTTSFPASYLEPAGEVCLYGRTFPAPSPADSFLRLHRYGPDCMTPFRGVRSGSRWCPTLTPEEMTPVASVLFARISELEVVLLERLYRSRLSRLLPWELYWLDPGLPDEPSQSALNKVEAGLAAADRTHAVEGLIRSLAILEQAISELEDPPKGLRLRRAGRRARWLRRKVAGRLGAAASRTTDRPASVLSAQ